ncbi:DUF1800 family protein [Pseudonocardia sp. WMMC193]|uniref:DUF1800 domain-containing protein n=1 Tax=Pseudonocardia sp. WMMC193 TaxID=2911965 RepID=UPI001F3AA1C0|nr:DUF1800 domain-containing protein [Pseudonocardia sp. WMMC193]MCF7547846.1 DUF1800 domain-containing protein [Pseudonocardia sp. WMMC193]
MSPIPEPERVRRLVERLAFGAVPSDAPDAPDDPDAVGAALLAQQPGGVEPPDLGAPPAVDAKDPAVKAAAEKALSAQNSLAVRWWVDRMVSSPTPLVEKVTWFWHGHFATGAGMVRSAGLMVAQNQTLRALGLGGFEPLAQAMVVDPAMVVWLNGNQNRAGAPNENLGRELMELFVLGVGNYTEPDVKEAARALTGWTVDRDRMRAVVDPKRFDAGPKTVLGAPVSDAHSLVAMLVARPESARFVVARVWARFVSDTPPPPDVVERLVAAFGAGRDVRALLGAVVAEPLFADPGSQLVKQPVEWAVGLMRAVGVRPAELADKDWAGVQDALGRLGQVPFQPPSVGGWPAGQAWLTTGAALARLSLAQVVARNVGEPPRTIEEAGAMLGVAAWSPRTRAALDHVRSDPRQLLAVAATSPEYVVSR